MSSPLHCVLVRRRSTRFCTAPTADAEDRPQLGCAPPDIARSGQQCSGALARAGELIPRARSQLHSVDEAQRLGQFAGQLTRRHGYGLLPSRQYPTCWTASRRPRRPSPGPVGETPRDRPGHQTRRVDRDDVLRSRVQQPLPLRWTQQIGRALSAEFVDDPSRRLGTPQIDSNSHRRGARR